ncbi:membrane hypothetical protein [metagenome]|uniref:Uncharacterized protein n=1 Tax=metagenome TaxID=256318 RepID=A0A2P2C9E3_9ZZZZ
MRLWASQRRIWLLVVTIGLVTAGALWLQSRAFAMPTIIGSGGMALWATFLPLIWAVAVADAFSSKTQGAEARPGPRVAGLDLLLFVLATTTAATAACLAAGGQSATATTAHILIMSGLACMVTLSVGAASAMLAGSALMAITTPYGHSAFAGSYVRVLQPDGDTTWSLIVGITLCLCACLMLATRATTINLSRTAGLVG